MMLILNISTDGSGNYILKVMPAVQVGIGENTSGSVFSCIERGKMKLLRVFPRVTSLGSSLIVFLNLVYEFVLF